MSRFLRKPRIDKNDHVWGQIAATQRELSNPRPDDANASTTMGLQFLFCQTYQWYRVYRCCQVEGPPLSTPHSLISQSCTGSAVSKLILLCLG